MPRMSEDLKTAARAWFETLQGEIVAAYEAIEDAYGGDAHGYTDYPTAA